MRLSPPTRRGRRPWAPLLAAALLATAVLAGCSGADEKSGAGGAPALTAPAEQDHQDSGAEEAPNQADAPAPDDEGDKRDDSSGTDVDVSERSRVHTADLAVEVESVEDTASRAAEWVRDADGYVASEDVSTATGEPPRAQLALKVPMERYEEALKHLGGLGERVDLQRDVEDVTEQVADVDSRVKSAEASLDRLRELLADAEGTDEVLEVEREISDRQQELEALQARQRSLAEKTTYGTINLTLTPPDTYIAEEEQDDSIGFLGGLERGWRALVAAAQAVSVAAGWLLPFLAVAAAIVAPVVLWWRHRRARRGRASEDRVPAATAPPPADEAAESGEPGPSEAGGSDGPDTAAAPDGSTDADAKNGEERADGDDAGKSTGPSGSG